ncbi:MAG: hybrid sensor histidine kinase/response regulator [Calditrichaeota bacterium]|nr:MAG: hybrid sensor histidine kinase/response regulator [Calditrichota bacterium]
MNVLKKIKYMVSLLILAHPLLYGQKAQDIYFKHLTVKEGLSNSTVYSIAQDKDGYIWFGTPNGLNRFDGYSVKVFKHQTDDSTSILSNNAGNIYMSREGIMYIGSWGGGLEAFDPGTFKATHYIHKANDPNTISDNRVQSLYEDEKGIMWLGTFSGGLNRFDPKSKTFRVFKHDPDDPHSLSNNRIWAIAPAEGNKLWVGTSDGLNLFDPASGKAQRFYHDPNDANSISHNVVRNFLVQDSLLWMGTVAGITRLNTRTMRFKRYLYHPVSGYRFTKFTINAIYRVREGAIWFGSGDGIFIFDPKTETFRHIKEDSSNPVGLNDIEVRSIYQDRSGVIWVGTKNKGINYTNPVQTRRFRTMISQDRGRYKLQGVEIHAVSGFNIDGHEYILFSNPYGLYRYDPQNGAIRFYSFNQMDARYLQGNFINSIYPDPVDPNVIWLGTQKQVYVYNPRKETFHSLQLPYKIRGEVTFSTVTSIRRVGRYIWFGNYLSGLGKLDPETGKLVRQFTPQANDPNSISHNEVYFVEYSGKDHLWVGTGISLDRLDLKSEKFDHIAFPKQYDHDRRFFTIFVESDSLIWLGTEDGLIRYNPQTGQNRLYNMADGLPDNKISFIRPSNKNYLWVGTERGLAYMDKKLEMFVNYNLSDGLTNYEYVPNAAWQGEDGTFYFGGKQGLDMVLPGHPDNVGFTTPVVLNNLLIFNKEIPQKNNPILPVSLNRIDELKLRYDDYVFSIEFAALDYARSDNINYAYKLEGFDSHWIYTDARRRYATYTSVPGGHYIFKVKATNRNGEWSKSYKSLKIYVIPPFWKTPLFILFSIILAFALLIVVYRWRTMSMHRRNRELSEINEKLNQQIVQREKAEAENRALHQQLLQTQKMEAIGVLAGGIAHDFNNLLTAILGNIELSKLFKGNAAKVEELLTSAEKACVRARGLTQQLLTFSKGGEPVVETVCLSDVVKESSGFVLAGSSVTQTYHIPEDLWLANVDKGQIGQVVQNIIINAKEALNDKGHIEIRLKNVAAGTVNGLPDPDQQYVGVHISDNGPGIPEKILDQIFTPYFTTKETGNGLGLAVSFSIIKKHGGVLWVRSQEGQGTQFSIYLPACAECSREDWEKESRLDTYQQYAITVLLMDDEQAVRDVAGGLLEKLGCTVDAVPDGETAVYHYKEHHTAGHPYDLVIVDLTVPGGMGGLETLEALMKIDAHVRVVVSSGYAHDPIMSHYKKHGFAGVIVKPYTFNEIHKVLNQLFKSTPSD